MSLAPLVGKQADSVHQAVRRVNVWEGSVRSSKTISSLVRWLRFVRDGPRGNLLAVGRTERTLRRNVIDPLTDILGPRRCRYVAGAGELYLLGRRIYVAGANDETAQEKIRGLTLAGAYLDEASTIPESFWTMLLSRLSIQGAQLFATTNPDSPAHWLKKDWLDRAAVHLTGDGRVRVTPCPCCGQLARLGHTDADTRLNLARFSFRLTDNPHLPRDYVDALSREFVGLWHRRYILGEWVVAEGAVYDMFDPERHVVDGLPEGEHVTGWLGVGVDYGTTNPFAALRLGLTSRGRLYVGSEWRHDARAARRQMTDAEYSAGLRTWLAGQNPGWLVIDPSAASFKVQAYYDGLGAVTDADNEVLDGIRKVASLLATDRLVVDASCTGLLDELPGYSWDDSAADKGEDKPLKINDHSCDALRYVVNTTERLWHRQVATG